ncbi:MAG TPA: hypothetical protein VKA12_09620 [Roseiarcus sp.]|nr:hypothetical protein [Roseiarcus sp.]
MRGVLAEYDAYLPLTARQIYYRLIGLDVIEKGDASYELAVTPQQVIELGLTTQTANPADAREFDGVNGDGVSTCQAEAIPPDQLAEIVRSAVLAEIDREAMARTRVRQQVDIAVLRAMVPELWAEES